MVGQEEVPNIDVVPVEDWEDPHELWPAGAALTDGLEIVGPRVSAPVAHQDRFNLLFVDQTLNFCLKVRAEKLHLYAVVLLNLVTEGFDFVELAILDKMYVFDAPKCILSFSVYFAEGSKQM